MGDARREEAAARATVQTKASEREQQTEVPTVVPTLGEGGDDDGAGGMTSAEDIATTAGKRPPEVAQSPYHDVKDLDVLVGKISSKLGVVDKVVKEQFTNRAIGNYETLHRLAGHPTDFNRDLLSMTTAVKLEVLEWYHAATGASFEDALKKATEVVLKDVVSAVRVVFDELKVAHRAEETSRTRAYMGEQALDAYKHLHGQVPAFEKVEGEPAIASEEILGRLAAAPSEGAALKILLREMNQAVRELEPHEQDAIGVGIFDSQSVSWLPQSKSHRYTGLVNRCRPDLFSIFEAFVTHQYEGERYQGARPTLEDLIPAVQAIIEGKKFEATSNDALGQVIDYLENFYELYHVTIMNAVCVDRESFRLLTISSGRTIAYIRDGKLADPGSKDAIARHMLGFVRHDTTRVISDLQRASISVFDVCRKKWNLVPSKNSILGKGATATVYAMETLTNAAESLNGASQAADKMAVKVAIGLGGLTRLGEEREIHSILQKEGEESTGQLFVPMDMDKYHEYADDVGPKFACTVYKSVGKPIESFKSALHTLFAFHEAGWVHRDARVPNFIMVNGKVYLIDLATASKTEDANERRLDIAMFALSALRLPQVKWGHSWVDSFPKESRIVVDIIRSLYTPGVNVKEAVNALVEHLSCAQHLWRAQHNPH